MNQTTAYTGLPHAVQAIKNAILQSQQRALAAINQEQLTLYYGIGRFVPVNTRNKNWGKGFIEAISQQLRKELPGLRGFSVTNLRKMLEEGESSVRTDELENNSIVLETGLTTKNIQDYDKPMGVATYKTTADMDERLKKLLPPVEELEKLL